MARWILLGLEADEVDVISRLVRDERPEEVMVYHPDPEALVLQLALLADLPRVDQPPEPRADDVLVVSGHATGGEWEEAWRRVGARILDPGTAAARGEGGIGSPESARAEARVAVGAEILRTPGHSEDAAKSSRETRTSSPPALRVLPRNDLDPESEDGMSEESPVGPGPVGETTLPEVSALEPEAAPSHPRSAAGPGRGSGSGSGETPSARIWESPEATFRYLLERAGVKNATLWWDGEAQTWIPWLEIGEGPGSDPAQGPPAGLEIESRWGRFVLAGVHGRERDLYPPALSRVAEDMALREIEAWRRESGRLRALLPISRGVDIAAWSHWLDEALPTLAPSAALLWVDHGDGWRLCRAWGEGVGQSGELRLPPALFTATFGPTTSWHSWNLLAGLRVVFTAPGTGSRWPLSLRRLDRLVGGESPR